jgi:hypothetical protein
MMNDEFLESEVFSFGQDGTAQQLHDLFRVGK